MTGLIRAEYRKILSTKMWWGLLIPVVAMAIIANVGGSGLARLVSDLGSGNAPFVLLTMSVAIGFAGTFAAVLGALAFGSEHRHRTISTTLLTARSRSAVLLAKIVTYTSIGLVYGVATVVFGTLGGLVVGGTTGFPGLPLYLGVAAIGCLGVVLWTLIGIGVGALFGNQLAAILVVALYPLGEVILTSILTSGGAEQVANYLPGNASSALTSDLAMRSIAESLGVPTGAATAELEAAMRDATTQAVGLSWWVAALVVAGYALVLVWLGKYAEGRRDIT